MNEYFFFSSAISFAAVKRNVDDGMGNGMSTGNDVGTKFFFFKIEWLEQIIAKNKTKKIGFFEHCQKIILKRNC